MGSFRIAELLGHGGMGEVYRAYDERLERWVALKRVAPRIVRDPEARHRLLREARMAARFNHPAIVQIYELVEDGDEVWIVLELVVGTTLASRLAEGPLPLPAGLAVARSLAAALAYAHRQGVIHRDLKPENVLLVAGDQPKIVDFGLSRRVDGSDRLTDDGRVLGSYRHMSPEQSRGLEVDARSDLFSLGILLYEIFTGQPPFADADPVAVITRIRTHRQVSARERAPQLPRELSRLIDDLLEKSPRARPESATAVLDALDAAAARLHGSSPDPPASTEPGDNDTTLLGGHLDAAWLGVPRRRGPRVVLGVALGAVVALATLVVLVYGAAEWNPWVPASSLRVAVAKPLVSAGDGAEEAIIAGAATQAAVLERLLLLEGLTAIDADPLDAAGQPPAPARALGVDEVLRSRLDCQRRSCRATLVRTLAEGGRVQGVVAFQIPTDDLPVLVAAVRAKVRELYAKHEPRPGVLEERGSDYGRLLELRREYLERTRPTEAVLDDLAKLRQASPGLVEAYISEALIRYEGYFYSRDPAELERVLELFEKARALDPGNPSILLRIASVALDRGALDQAREVVRELETREPGDPRVLAQRARLEELEGRGEQALEHMRTATGRWPAWFLFFDQAQMEYRQGEVLAARGTSERVLELFPEHFRSRSFLAQLELLDGSPARAEELYRSLVEASPGPAELSNLALAQMLQRRPAEAAESFRRALALAPGNPVMILNLADALSLAGQDQEAPAFYRQVLEASDSSAQDWQELSVRAQALAHLGRQHQAVAAIQQALGLSPQNPQLAYEAALVYALAGDHTSAVVHAERARSALDSRWFELPWFDPLRADRRFQGLIGDAGAPAAEASTLAGR